MTASQPGLREQLEALEQSVPPATPPEIRAGYLQRVRWLSLAAVLLLGIIIGLGGGKWLANLGEPDASTSPVPSATARPSESETPSATEAATPTSTATPSMALTVVSTSGLEAEDELRAITFARGGLIAVGRRGQDGAVWLSSDGTSWTLAPELPAGPSADGDPGGVRMDRIVDGPAGMVAVGMYSSEGDVAFGHIWYSPDGERWTDVYRPDGFSRIVAVSTGGPGYVAVGLVSDDAQTARPQIWISVDGQTWTVGSSPASRGSLTGVVEGPGLTVIVGSNETDGTAYVSTDGVTWEAAPEQTSLAGAELTSVTYFQGRFLATGQIGGPDRIGGVWHSHDGLAWTRVLVGEPGQVIHQVIGIEYGPLFGGEFVAIGGLFPSHSWSWDPATPIPPKDMIQIWRSTDGTNWDGPTTAFVGPGGIVLGQAGAGQEVFLPVNLLVAGPTYPIWEYAVLRGLEP